MKAGSTPTRTVVVASLGVGGPDESGAELDEAGSDEGGPPSVIGVSVRCGRLRAIRAAL